MDDQPTGSVALALQVSPGVLVTAGSYSITGPNAFMAMGSVPVGQTSDVPVVLGALPVGVGYTLVVNALASDGVTACSGSAPFDISQAASSTVIVHLVCRVPPRAGALLVLGSTNVCPSIDGIGASPAEARVGASMALTAAAHDADGSTVTLSYSWSASGGLLSTTSQPNASLTCTQPGVVTLSLTVSDGDASCNDNLTINVSCTAAP